MWTPYEIFTVYSSEQWPDAYTTRTDKCTSSQVMYCSLTVERSVSQKYASSTFFYQLLTHTDTHTHLNQKKIDLLTCLKPSCACAHETCPLSAHARTSLCLPWYSNFFNQIDGATQRQKWKKGKKTEAERGGEANLCFMIWLHSAAHTHTHTSAIQRLLTVVTTCQGEHQAANLKSLDVCRSGNNLLRFHTHKHTHTKHIAYTHWVKSRLRIARTLNCKLI